MTAFARGEVSGEWGTLVCELRGVNHRYLDLNPRLPDDLRIMEGTLRERLKQRLGRGKVDCFVRYIPTIESAPALNINHALVREVLSACEQVESLMGASTQFHALELLRWPGVVREPERDMGTLHAAALSLLDKTLRDFLKVRSDEGKRLAALIQKRAREIETLIGRLRERRQDLIAGLREKYRSRLAELGVDAEPGRLEQELAIIAQRLDVDEELDRLDSHLTELETTLGRNEPIGRRLDFLMQEFNREVNTLGSKSADIATTQTTVELKVLIEQMREQVQNIE
ncbi:YicC/YloC family endoribonuclease [Acidihalobacter prosperus]